MKSGEAFDGVIWAWEAGVLELKGASHLVAAQPPSPVDGSVIVLEADVDFVQDPKGD